MHMTIHNYVDKGPKNIEARYRNDLVSGQVSRAVRGRYKDDPVSGQESTDVRETIC